MRQLKRKYRADSSFGMDMLGEWRRTECKMSMEYKPTCKKKKGRPRRTWFDRITEAMEKKGIEKE